jgi:hypothetical protein
VAAPIPRLAPVINATRRIVVTSVSGRATTRSKIEPLPAEWSSPSPVACDCLAQVGRSDWARRLRNTPVIAGLILPAACSPKPI